jgi:hypothetical protein
MTNHGSRLLGSEVEGDDLETVDALVVPHVGGADSPAGVHRRHRRGADGRADFAPPAGRDLRRCQRHWLVLWHGDRKAGLLPDGVLCRPRDGVSVGPLGFRPQGRSSPHTDAIVGGVPLSHSGSGDADDRAAADHQCSRGDCVGGLAAYTLGRQILFRYRVEPRRSRFALPLVTAITAAVLAADAICWMVTCI